MNGNYAALLLNEQYEFTDKLGNTALMKLFESSRVSDIKFNSDGFTKLLSMESYIENMIG